jgi:hypothetical protein
MFNDKRELLFQFVLAMIGASYAVANALLVAHGQHDKLTLMELFSGATMVAVVPLVPRVSDLSDFYVDSGFLAIGVAVVGAVVVGLRADPGADFWLAGGSRTGLIWAGITLYVDGLLVVWLGGVAGALVTMWRQGRL